MASSDPAAHQLQLSLVADFLRQHGMTASLAALGDAVGTSCSVVDRKSLVKSLRLSKLAAKSAYLAFQLRNAHVHQRTLIIRPTWHNCAGTNGVLFLQGSRIGFY